MDYDERLVKKAELSMGGGVRLPAGFVIPYRVSHSTAGPGAGSSALIFAFDGCQVKKAISYEQGEFELGVAAGGRLYLTRDGHPFLDRVELRPVVFHCPDQAFFNLDQRCIYSCAFCASPRLKENTCKGMDETEIVALVRKAMRSQKVEAVSLTSGIVESVGATVQRLTACVRAVWREFPALPIGVEAYVETERDLRALREAGTTEVKLNLETAAPDLFCKVCPDLDYDHILRMLAAAVVVFGRGRVSSNILYGMGETDEVLEETADRLSALGVVPVLRALRHNCYNEESLRAAIGEVHPVTPERAIRVSRIQKEVMGRHGLTTKEVQTMCLKCTCCDLVPFKDL
ncbi:MAG: radical SAM protein [Candidatus Methanomethylophilus sp.]|nr:radical SAM protein [Methanomethylophilus sp.]